MNGVLHPVFCETCVEWIGRAPRDELAGLIALHEATTHGRASVRVSRPDSSEFTTVHKLMERRP
jgi:hypothetical protein